MYKPLRFSVFIVALALLVVACGGGSKPTPTPPEPPKMGQLQFAVEPNSLGAKPGDELIVTLERGGTVEVVETEFDTWEHVFYRDLEAGTWHIIVKAPTILGTETLTDDIEIVENERTLVWWRVLYQEERGRLDTEASDIAGRVDEDMFWPLAEGNVFVYEYDYRWRYGNHEDWTEEEGTFDVEVVSAEREDDVWTFTRVRHLEDTTGDVTSITYNDTTGDYTKDRRTMNFMEEAATWDGYECDLGLEQPDKYMLDCSGRELLYRDGTVTYTAFRQTYEREFGQSAYELAMESNGLFVTPGYDMHEDEEAASRFSF